MASRTVLTLKLLLIAYAISSIASTNHHFLNGIGKPIKNLHIAAAQLAIFILTLFILRTVNYQGPTIFAYAFITSHLIVLALSAHYTIRYHKLLYGKLN